ncbi:MAG: IS1595 family transposase [Deltaproteobacteria bacterium]|nr:IS1595 family transposase [Deltaproteobacteria bacterium]
MELNDYHKLISSESRARKYLLGKCLKNHQRFCPRCRCRKLYKLREGRNRCSGRFSAVQWLSLIKLFELEVSVRKMSLQLGLSYRAVYRAVSTIRMAILSHAEDAPSLLDGEIEIDEAYFGGRRKGKRGRAAAGKVPVFGILERDGRVHVSVVPDVSAATLLKLTVKKVRRGSIVYTDKFHSYDSLMFCGYRHLKVDHQKYFSSGRVYINGLEGFWSWAKERLIKYHGVSRNHFPLYLKELEFRYNNRNGDLFNQVANYLCDLVPKRD